jgi:hypothetical protein
MGKITAVFFIFFTGLLSAQKKETYLNMKTVKDTAFIGYPNPIHYESPNCKNVIINASIGSLSIQNDQHVLIVPARTKENVILTMACSSDPKKIIATTEIFVSVMSKTTANRLMNERLSNQ